jgi:hypothetical protein
MKILLGYFNEKLRTEYIFKPTVVNRSLHESINTNNDVRAVKFSISKNLVAKNNMFPHQYIHKHTWTSHNGKTHSHIDHKLK